MYNPHQELLEHFQTLTTKIESLELLIQTKSVLPESTSEKDILFTPKQLAEYWGCHVQTIHNKKRDGQIPFIQNNRILLFSKKAIDKISTIK